MVALKMNLKVEALVQAKVLHAEIGFRVRTYVVGHRLQGFG